MCKKIKKKIKIYYNMDNVIQIEIAQRDSSSVISNGDFINDLAVPVILEEGDQIVLNKTFIDTEAETSGLIDIESDITVKLAVLPYVTAEVPNKFVELQGVTTNIPIDNVDYFPLRLQSTKDGPTNDPKFADVIVIRAVTFFYDNHLSKDEFGSVDDPLFLYYYDIHQNYQEIPFQLLKTTAQKGPIPNRWPTQTFVVNIVCLDMSKIDPTNPIYSATSDSYQNGLGVHWDQKNGKADRPKDLVALWDANGCDSIAMTAAQQATYNSGAAPTPGTAKLHGGFGVSNRSAMPQDVIIAASLETDEFTLDIPQGKYTPTEITTLLNNGFVKNYTNSQFSYNNLLDSAFLKFAFLPNLPVPPANNPVTPAPLTKSGIGFTGTAVVIKGSGNNRTRNHVLVSNSGTPNVDIDVDNTGRSVGYNPPLFSCMQNTFVLGTDNIEIEYDEETSLFFWKQLHHSVYDFGNGTPITQVARRHTPNQPNEPEFTYFIRSKAGGVCFTSMYACLQSNSEVGYDFWSKKLGFDTSSMCVAGTNAEDQYKQDSIGNVEMIFNSPKIIDGVNTTNATHTIDGLTVKTGNAYRTRPLQPPFDAGTESTVFDQVQSNNNIVIFAKNSTVSSNPDRTITDSGYYLIEMIAGFQNTMIGSQKTEKNIHGIVNRYFNRGSYTSSTEQDSLVYTHRGAPLILSSIRSRILLPNRTVPDNIGSDNTIFLQVIKAQQPPGPPPKK